MLILDPPPLPDESLYSLECRAYLIDAGFTHRKTLKYIFDPMMQASDLEMIGSRFYWFWQTCLEPYWPFPKAIMETTLFRLYGPFLSLSNRKLIVNWVGKNSLSIRLMLDQFFYVENLDLYYLKYCPECISADIDQHGVAYWHRSHCCKFAFACHRHSCELVKVGFIPKGDECFHLPAYSDAGKGKPVKLLIEPMIFKWLNNPADIKQTPDTLKKQLLTDIKMAFDDDPIEAAGILQSKIEQRLPPSDLEKLAIRYCYPDGERRCWVLDALTFDRKSHFPEIMLIRPLL